MKILVWNRYPDWSRLGLTFTFLAIAVGLVPFYLEAWTVIPVLGAAIAFNIENKLIIDSSMRTYERRAWLKPFGKPGRGSFDNIRDVQFSLDLVPERDGTSWKRYGASVRFKEPVCESFLIVQGSKDHVLDEVARFVKATGAQVSQSDDLDAERIGLDSMPELLAKLRR